MSKERRILLTPLGLQQLDEEIEKVESKLAGQSPDSLAAGFAGNLDSDDLGADELRLEQLKQKRLAARPLTDFEAKKLGVGRRITIFDESVGAEEIFLVLSPGEADPLSGIIACDTPLARSTLGRGDGVSLNYQGGHRDQRKITLLKTEWVV